MKIVIHVDRVKQQLCQLYGEGGNSDIFTPQQLQDKWGFTKLSLVFCD